MLVQARTRHLGLMINVLMEVGGTAFYTILSGGKELEIRLMQATGIAYGIIQVCVANRTAVPAGALSTHNY